MSSGFNIRQATSNDCKIVYDFICELEDQKLAPRSFDEIFELNLKNPYIQILLAEIEGKPKAFASVHVQPLLHHAAMVAEIQEIFVRHDARNLGLGTALLDRLMAFASSKGAVQIEAASNQRRTAAHRFYKRQGFSQSHFKFVQILSA